MAKFYGLKIKDGELTITDVPKLWRTAVKKWLEENGCLSNECFKER